MPLPFVNDSHVFIPRIYVDSTLCDSHESFKRRMRNLLTAPVLAIVVSLLLVVAFLSGAAMVLTDAHSQIEKTSSGLARRLAGSLQQEVSRDIDLIDLSIQAVADAAGQPAVMRLPTVLRDQLFFSRAGAARYVQKVSLIDEHGAVISESLSTSDAGPSQRHYVDAQRVLVAPQSRDNSRLMFGNPYRALDGLTRLIDFSRDVWTPSGAFAGTVVATVNLTNFSNIFFSLNAPAHTRVTLKTMSSEELMRNDDFDGRDTALPASSFVTRMTNAIMQSIGKHGDDDVTVDSAVPGMPMLVSVVLSGPVLFAAWHDRVTQVTEYCLLISLLFVLMAASLAYALHRRAQSELALGRLASLDALTGLPNRRALDRTFQQAFEHAKRSRTPLSILFLDVDDFKNFNDRYGHVAGDQALQAVAAAIRTALSRNSHFVARYGGEEFVVIFPETGGPLAVSLAERVRLSVRSLRLEHAAAPAQIVTASIGVASFDTFTDTASAVLLARADNALYAAKRAGKDAVVMLAAVGLAT